ncbi:MAG: hypothetical protein HC812_01545 [Leptolyngbya sp. RL_3_1]|nr:hypothetical protein [Leptolyngbya sp. RL_3_1]
MVVKQWGGAAIAAGLLLATPVAAEAARLSVDGKVQLEDTAEPLGQTRVTVTFHGHELGIHEYTTSRTVRTSTDAAGAFAAQAKINSGRYYWTHATILVSATDRTKSHEFQSPCVGSDATGWVCSKDLWVSPIATELEVPLQAWLMQLEQA